MSLTVVILTRDEARHIERCIASVRAFASRVVVVDSGSTDATAALARASGAEVFVNEFVNHARQINWALANCAIDTEWTMRLDADEIVLPGFPAAFAALPSDATGATLNRQIHFLGRWIRWGGIYPVRQLRLWRTGRGQCEDRWMDEHMLVDGPVAHLDTDFADINLNNLGWWVAKHNGYATREAVQALLGEVAVDPPGHAGIKRRIKRRLYAQLPLGARALVYFIYRYIIRMGVLDGWQGLVFHGLQGGWFRFLIDAKQRELRDLMAARGQDLSTVAQSEYGLRLGPPPINS